MRNLAGLYEKGDGVAKDAAEALRWRRAAKALASPPGSTPIEAKSALVLAKDLSGHSDYVVAVSFSPDGKRLASGSYDSTIILWETASGNLIRKFEPGVGKVYAVAFSPDGKVLASSHTDGDIKLWDVESGRLLQSLKADTYAVYLLAFTPDGALLAGQSAFTINLWEVATGKVARSLKGISTPISFSAMAMSPGGKQIVSGDNDGSVRIWDVAEGRQLQELEAHITPVRAVAFSPDGEMLASASGDKTVKLWSLGSIMAAGR